MLEFKELKVIPFRFNLYFISFENCFKSDWSNDVTYFYHFQELHHSIHFYTILTRNIGQRDLL